MKELDSAFAPGETSSPVDKEMEVVPLAFGRSTGMWGEGGGPVEAVSERNAVAGSLHPDPEEVDEQPPPLLLPPLQPTQAHAPAPTAHRMASSHTQKARPQKALITAPFATSEGEGEPRMFPSKVPSSRP